MIIVTPEQMKYLEAEADRNGNTYEMLMEKAGERLAEKIISIINIEKNKDKNHIFDIIFLSLPISLDKSIVSLAFHKLLSYKL
mgnify:CR=1 FL=1